MIERKNVQYVVCRLCGSTAIKIPPGTCPICDHSSESYMVVERDFFTKKKPGWISP